MNPFCILKLISQTRDVRVVKFVIENSIEQRILEIQQRKNVRMSASCTPGARLKKLCSFMLTFCLLQALAGTITNAPQPHETAATRMQDLQALLSE